MIYDIDRAALMAWISTAVELSFSIGIQLTVHQCNVVMKLRKHIYTHNLRSKSCIGWFTVWKVAGFVVHKKN